MTKSEEVKTKVPKHVQQEDTSKKPEKVAVATDKKTGKCNVCDQESHWARGCPVIAKYKKFQKDK